MVAVQYNHYKSGTPTSYRHVILPQPQCGEATPAPTFVCHIAFVVWWEVRDSLCEPLVDGVEVPFDSARCFNYWWRRQQKSLLSVLNRITQSERIVRLIKSSRFVFTAILFKVTEWQKILFYKYLCFIAFAFQLCFRVYH